MNATAHYKRGEWVTKEGRVIPVANMETSHLVNVAKILAVKIVRILRDDIDDYAILHDYEDYCPGYLDYSSYLTAHAFWPHLSAELDKRHIDVVKLVNDHLQAKGYSFRLDTTSTPKRFPSEADDNYGLTWPDNL